MEKKQR
jgi:hypothetical protein